MTAIEPTWTPPPPRWDAAPRDQDGRPFWTVIAAGPGVGKTKRLVDLGCEARLRFTAERVLAMTHTGTDCRKLDREFRRRSGKRGWSHPTVKTISAVGWSIVKDFDNENLALRDGHFSTPADFYVGARLRQVEAELAGHAPAGAWLADYRARLAAMGSADMELVLRDAARLLRRALPRRLHYFKAILIDEAADCTPAQWDFIDALCEAADGAESMEMTAVGDYDQALYTFAGATPAIFLQRLRTADRTECLNESWRCGDGIAALVNAIAGEQRLIPLGHEGTVHLIGDTIPGIDDTDTSHWIDYLPRPAAIAARRPDFRMLIVARSSAMLRPVVSALRTLSPAIPYALCGPKLRGRHVKIAPEVRAVLRAFDRWRVDQHTPDELALLSAWYHGNRLPRREGSYTRAWAFSELSPPLDATDQTRDAWRYRCAYDAGTRPGKRHRPWLTVSTTHSAKGDGWDTVLWLCGGTDDDSPEERKRLHFVTASRAKSRLLICGDDPELRRLVAAAGGEIATAPQTVLGRLASAVLEKESPPSR